jgi:hypothetical protein
MDYVGYKRVLSFFFIIALAACNTKEPSANAKMDNTVVSDTITKTPPKTVDTLITSKVYSNERFKDVTVTKSGDHSFLVKGKGQIFEANFGWVVEDGHDELQKGHQMTDAGAPAWGNFSFTIDVPKTNPNSTLLLILFESSPKDGRRTFELPVLLY